jgi:hypothetical protein
MKVNRKKFIEAVNYIKKINQCKQEELDLSEFTQENLTKKIKKWKFTGLNNRDFILEILE